MTHPQKFYHTNEVALGDNDTAARKPLTRADKMAMLEHEASQEAAHEERVRAFNQALYALEPSVIALVTQFGKIIGDWNLYQGFWQSENVGEKIALMHSELSEALEADRKNLPSEHLHEGFTGVEEELADTIIRILDFAGHFKLRLGEALIAKLVYNTTRPYKHGKGY